MKENDGSTARGFDPDTRTRSLEGRLAREVRQGACTPGPSPKGAAEGIDHDPVVPRGHRPFSRRGPGLANADRPRPAGLDQAARRCLTVPDVWEGRYGQPMLPKAALRVGTGGQADLTD